MNTSDPIADMLTRIRNAIRAGHVAASGNGADFHANVRPYKTK